MTKKKRLNRKEKRKVIESLMGYYQATLSIFSEGCKRFEDRNLSALIIKAHMHEIINFHAERAIKVNLMLPKITEIYKDYIDVWNQHILSKEDDMKKLIKDHTTIKRYDYIS